MGKADAEQKPDVARILVVDDHPMMRQGLRDAVRDQPDLEVVAEAGNSSETLTQLSSQRFDLIVLDVSFQSGESGIELIKSIRARGDDTKILVFSMHDESLYAERSLRAGAQGYIEKARPSEEMQHAIRTILKGDLFLSQRMSDILLRRAVTGRSTDALLPEHTLSDRELEVLELIGRGLTTRKIAENLCLSEKTIETHRQNIKNKLGLESGTQLIRHAVQWVDKEKPAAPPE